jgi:hypothetical protein
MLGACPAKDPRQLWLGSVHDEREKACSWLLLLVDGLRKHKKSKNVMPTLA